MSKLEPKPLLQFLYDPETNELMFIQDADAINALGPPGVKALQGLLHTVGMQCLGHYSPKRHKRLKKKAAKAVRTKLLATAQGDHDKEHALKIFKQAAIGIGFAWAVWGTFAWLLPALSVWFSG